MKSSVDQYFSVNRVKKTGNWKLYVKALTLVPVAIGLYIMLLSVHLSTDFGNTAVRTVWFCFSQYWFQYHA
ncbi:MAG: hypothetical protein WDM78_17235 [Puia sp.]